MDVLVRIGVADLALKTGVIGFLHWIGWLTLMKDGQAVQGAGQTVGSALACAFVFSAIALFLLWIGGEFFFFSLMLPFIGGMILVMVKGLAPSYLALDDGSLLTFVSGFMILVTTPVLAYGFKWSKKKKRPAAAKKAPEKQPEKDMFRKE